MTRALEGGRNTIVFEDDEALRRGVFELFSTSHSPNSGASSPQDLLCCLPHLDAPTSLTYENVFRENSKGLGARSDHRCSPCNLIGQRMLGNCSRDCRFASVPKPSR